MTFAIWIGLGALAALDGADKLFKKKKLKKIIIPVVSVLLLIALPMNLLLPITSLTAEKGIMLHPIMLSIF